MPAFTYELNGSLYLNLTNRCSNSCTFCIKYKSRSFEGRHDLWLTREPQAEEVLKEVGNPARYRQIVFCGYGEPLIRLETVKKIAGELKKSGAYIRIDTDGQANLFHGRNIIPELAGLINELNISLNAQDSGTYEKLCRSVWGEKGYQAILDFAKKAKEASPAIPKVVLSLVDLPSVNKEKCAQIAESLGVELRVRPYYEETYVA
ncbi:MAG: TatD family nuclease-associated radical SAM protein [Candidatus Margulisiibacteriota bacterium]